MGVRPSKGSGSVRVGIIGAGSVLWAYLQQLDRLIPRGLASLGPVCARREDSWPQLRERRPGIELVREPREVIESDVDAVLIITAAGSHAELTRAALEAGRHVLCEKPIALSRDAGESLVELAAARGRHLVAAPFVHLSPTFRALWGEIHDGAIGHVHSARGLYGVAAPDWNSWMFEAGAMADLGVYNLKSLTALLGPAVEVTATTAAVAESRQVHHRVVTTPRPDVVHVTLRHDSGALSSVIASWDIHAYRRPALELYGTSGTAVLLGDDWDPRGYEIYRNAAHRWESTDSLDPTWLWTDGLRELVAAIREDRPPRGDLDHDLHVLELLEAADRAAIERRPVDIKSRFRALELRLTDDERPAGHLHDHTRPPSEQR